MKGLFKSSEKFLVLLFLIFLRQNGAYRSFMRNCSEFNPHSRIADLESTSPNFYISDAFGWPLTPEGGKYWSDLNDKWLYVLYLLNF